MVSFVKKYRIKNFKKMTAILLAIKNFFQRLFFFFLMLRTLFLKKKETLYLFILTCHWKDSWEMCRYYTFWKRCFALWAQKVIDTLMYFGAMNKFTSTSQCGSAQNMHLLSKRFNAAVYKKTSSSLGELIWGKIYIIVWHGWYLEARI